MNFGGLRPVSPPASSATIRVQEAPRLDARRPGPPVGPTNGAGIEVADPVGEILYGAPLPNVLHEIRYVLVKEYSISTVLLLCTF